MYTSFSAQPARSRPKVLAITAAAVLWTVAAATRMTAAESDPIETPVPDRFGLQTTLSDEPLNIGPFFEELGTNGRTCASCHRVEQGWSITPKELQERFERTEGLDPVFRTNDGANCEEADVSTLRKRRRAFSLLLTRGLIRIGLTVPWYSEFSVAGVEDRFKCHQVSSDLSLYRRPLPATNLGFVTNVMWDGRENAAGSLADKLSSQAMNATIRHAQGAAPTAVQLRDIVNFELGLFTAQSEMRRAGPVNGRAYGGPDLLRSLCNPDDIPFPIIVLANGCLETSFRSSMFSAWLKSSISRQRSIARGEELFFDSRIIIDKVPGFGRENEVVFGTCATCHFEPATGHDENRRFMNIGVSDPDQSDLPRFTLYNESTGETTLTTDPGRAMVTGAWNDIGKFKVPSLRGLAGRAPYFHNGSARTFGEVLDFYVRRFKLDITSDERQDLMAFLAAL